MTTARTHTKRECGSDTAPPGKRERVMNKCEVCWADEKERLREYLEEYRKYLRKIKRDTDAHRSGYDEVSGAVKAVNYLLSELRKGKL